MLSEVRRKILTKQMAYYWLSQIRGNNKKNNLRCIQSGQNHEQYMKN